MTQIAGSPTSASAAVPRRPLRVLDLGRQLPLLAVVAVGTLRYLEADRAGDPSADRLARLVLLGCAVVAYVTLRRWAVWGWLAAVAVVPAAAFPGLLRLPPDAAAHGQVLLVVLVTAGLTTAAWRARSPVAVLALVAVTTAGGVVAAQMLGNDQAARASWSAASTFFLLALPAALGLFASVGLARADGSDPLRMVCGVVVLAPLLAVLIAHGDALAALVWWPAGGAIGVTAMLRGRRGSDVDRPQSDDVDRRTLAAFAAEHGRPQLGAVAVVVAAYDEADGLAEVLARVPERVCNLPADVVLVDDGSTDETAAVAAASFAELGRGHVLACPVNRGQGAALRLGYRFAREHGATYVVTTDADGQYDVNELSVVLRPVVDGRADFVTGSRRLGALYNRDRLRRLGTYLFALLASGLLGRWVTDTSFGLRAMRSEVTSAVTLNQPQYQASELLLSTVSHGFRVLEVPGTMRRRAAGSSKKGRNLVYGFRYGRVMLGTWWRDGAPRPVAESARALVSTRWSGRRERR